MHRLMLAAAYAALSLALIGSTACGSDTSSPAGPLPDTGPVPADCAYAEPTGPVFYVAVNGNDESGDGSETSPWGTITHATRTVPDGSTVLVEPGTYEGPIRLAGQFSAGITIRATTLYQTLLRTSTETVMFCYSCQGITIEGFDMAHSGEGAGPLVIHIGGEEVKNITVRNNIIHDSFNNDLLKVNNGATGVVVERNVFYNQQGSDEHIDINSAVDVLVQDNVFLNSFEGSGRINRNDTSAYIVVKDSNGRDDGYLGAERVVIRRNAFFNWEGSLGYNFVLIGEDGADYIEARDVLVENNLLLGNSSNDIRAPFGVKSGENITFRNNTIAGDLPGISFAMRVNIENQAIRNTNIRFFNNIWSDPTGTMSGFSATPPDETRSFELDNNLYWNGGQPIPSDADELINPDDDAHAVMGDPLLDDQSDILTPVWQSQIGRFGDGSNSTCLVLEQLVVRYASTAPNSAAIDMGRADEAPDHDILGRPRDGAPDIGAYEH